MISTNFTAISAGVPSKKMVEVLLLGGSNTFFVEEGEPQMPV